MTNDTSSTTINPFSNDDDTGSVTAFSIEADEQRFVLSIPKFAAQKPRKPFDLKLAGKDETGREIWKVPTLVNTYYETADAAPFRFVVSISRRASDSARLALYQDGIGKGLNVVALKGDEWAEDVLLRPATGGTPVKAKVRYGDNQPVVATATRRQRIA